MPIRFRCVYCEKLLGIARRKAGSLVNCPQCGEKLIVPTPDPSAMVEKEDEKEEDALAAAGPRLFERSDFDAMLQGEPTFRAIEEKPPDMPAPREKAVREPVAAPKLTPIERPVAPPAPAPAPDFDVVAPEGFFVTPSKATWLSVIAVVCLAVAFAAGLFIGRMLKS
ncbi:MAG: hypothetical protein K8T89_24425 [Planctomycetes bacterium]|nr:hypothetical protein [Planctomycetota bacterium]